MRPCSRCGDPDTRGGRTFGFDEQWGAAGEFCHRCEGEPSIKCAICSKDEGSRSCVQAAGRDHIHTSQGPLYLPDRFPQRPSRFDPSQVGGAFDGVSVSSDADPGL